jgi:AraC-like DNA-binding protein
MVKFLLSAAAAGGADTAQLVRDSEVPDWALVGDKAMISSRYSLRMWELAARAMEDPELPLTVVNRHAVGDLDLYDYLFATAGTLREGLAVSSNYLYMMTTNGQLRVEAETDTETIYSYSYIQAGGRAEELYLQFSVAVFCARAAAATGRPVIPVRVGFAHPAPRRHRAFIETFGTRQVDFGAPATTFTLRNRDLDQPMLGADPALAAILASYAETLPPPHPATWHDHFRQRLAQEVERGSPSLDTLARRLVVSPRTLQRRLAEHGTTWRAELEFVRCQRARQARRAGAADMTQLASHLGYADPRSARRFLRRWNDQAADPAGVPPARDSHHNPFGQESSLGSRTGRGASTSARARSSAGGSGGRPPGGQSAERIVVHGPACRLTWGAAVRLCAYAGK